MTNTNLNTQSVLSMKGEGYYSQKTLGAKNAIDKTQALIESALKVIPKTDILKMADYGSADGGTSQEMWFNIIEKIKNSGDERQIEILYTDLASNDFSVLFRTMQGMQGDKKFAFQKEFPNVFVHGCGTGFHEQLMSNNSLSLGFSATAMHYVSERPCLIKDHVHMVGAKENERDLFKKQALKDWEKILISRSKELVSGGRFVCINFGIDEKGRYLGNTGGHNMFDNFAKHWKNLETKNIISKDEFINFIENEQCQFIESLGVDGLKKFEWYINEETNTATLIEEFDNAESFKEIATKAIGTPVNLKFREITTFENMTILGDVSDEMKENLSAMGPKFRTFKAGLS